MAEFFSYDPNEEEKDKEETYGEDVKNEDTAPMGDWDIRTHNDD